MSRSRDNSTQRAEHDARRSTSPPGSQETGITLDPFVPLLPQGPEALIIPEGFIGEEAVELLHEFVHPHHTTVETLGDVERRIQQAEVEYTTLPWWRTPSPWWFLVVIPFSAMAMSSVMAPRIEIYTRLACEVHSPDSTIPEGMDPGVSILSNLFNSNLSHILSVDTGEPDKACASDPIVQAATAKLNMVYTTSMGILSCLTTAGWGSLSDRHGRTRILGIAVIGLLFTDINFIIVTKFWRSLPGGYWFFLVGALVEGSLGGMPAASAGIHAYIADCTDANNRSRFFSLFLGLLFSGMALGPTLGGLLIRYTGNLLVPFYFATSMHLFYAFFLWVIVPESLSRDKMDDARKSHALKLDRQRITDLSRPIVAKFKFLFSSLSPLKLFLSPPLRKGGNPSRPKRDWNLLFIALSYGGTMTLMGVFNYIFQYTSAAFSWKSEQIGYWLSIIGFTRAIYLTTILPVAIKLFKSKQPPIQLPVEPSEPLQPEEPRTSRMTNKRTTLPLQLHPISFDLGLAKFALIVDIVVHLFIPAAKDPLFFTALTIVGCMGAGFSPAIQSVAMGVYTQQGGTELGKLFGALSVMSALSSQILGPALFGITFMKTVATMPTAIFYVALAAVSFSFICVSFVRLPKEGEVVGDEEEYPAGDNSSVLGRDDTLVDTAIPIIVVEEDRNRKSSSP